jgi:hypothetical protein
MGWKDPKSGLTLANLRKIRASPDPGGGEIGHVVMENPPPFAIEARIAQRKLEHERYEEICQEREAKRARLRREVEEEKRAEQAAEQKRAATPPDPVAELTRKVQALEAPKVDEMQAYNQRPIYPRGYWEDQMEKRAIRAEIEQEQRAQEAVR